MYQNKYSDASSESVTEKIHKVLRFTYFQNDRETFKTEVVKHLNRDINTHFYFLKFTQKIIGRRSDEAYRLEKTYLEGPSYTLFVDTVFVNLIEDIEGLEQKFYESVTDIRFQSAPQNAIDDLQFDASLEKLLTFFPNIKNIDIILRYTGSLGHNLAIFKSAVQNKYCKTIQPSTNGLYNTASFSSKYYDFTVYLDDLKLVETTDGKGNTCF